MRELSPEARVASRLHPVPCSTGLVVSAADPSGGLGHVSFRIDADGTLVEPLGWGFAGPVPALVGDTPPNVLAVHTVLLDEPDDAERRAAVLAAVRRLVDEHLGRYGECRVWAAPSVSRGVAAWVKAGCPAGAPPPTDDDVAAARLVTQPPATSPMNDRRDGSNVGFVTSEPVGPPPERDDRDVQPAHHHP